jgi:O-antigen/teichoic acid export membrane protein
MSEPLAQNVAAASVTGTLGSRARSGSMWIIGGFGLGQMLRMGANIALAAILFEEVFALMAIVTAVMTGLAMFSDIGLRTNVVQHPRGDDPDFLNTAWTLQVIRGVCLFLIAVLLAGPLAAFYAANDPRAHELRYLIPIVALTSLISGFQSHKILSAARHLKIREVTTIEFIVVAFQVAAMLSLAWYLRSAYALAIASVLSATLHATLSYWMLDGAKSRFRWDPSAVRAIVSFGKWVVLSTLLTFLAIQLDRLALAGMFSLAEVGVYSIAASLAVIVPTLAGSLQGGVLFPWYSRKIEEGMPLPVAFARTRTAMMTFSSYLCALLFAGAGSFFALAYDVRYTMGAVLLPVLALGAWFSCLETMYGATFLATGRPKWVALTSSVKVASFALSLVVLYAFSLNIVTAAIFLSLSEALRWVVCRSLGARLGLRNARAEFGMLAFFLAVSLIGWWLAQRAPVISELKPFWRLAVLGMFITALFSPLFLRFVLPLVRQRGAT